MSVSSKRIYLYDTTLRDGAQTQGIDFSTADKIAIAKALDEFGMDYIEGGWPGANPTDDRFFETPPKLKNAVFTAFGMTRKAGRSAANDPGLSAVLNARTKAVCLVGKTWDFHVKVALGVSQQENLKSIKDSVAHAAKGKREALFDAEHFFDGYKANPKYALKCLQAALDAGARWIVLCDTNGGTLPHEIEAIVKDVCETIPGEKIGIHCHDDTGNAVANSLAAVQAGARMIQGTLNGLGERCGNANLVTLIPTLALKTGYKTGITAKKLKTLKQLSLLLDERLNQTPASHAPYVGSRAFAHKGGLHVSAVEKNPASYEHVAPEKIGNQREILVSDQAGKSNILSRLRAFGIKLDPNAHEVKKLVNLVKNREAEGYAYDGAEASFELLARRMLNQLPDYFTVERFSVKDERRFNIKGTLVTESEASVKVELGKETHHTVSDGNGPVHALDLALRKALEPAYPVLRNMKLVDYRVRILLAGEASAAMPRVLIESENEDGHLWRTIGVSTNIIDASLDALRDSYFYQLLKAKQKVVKS